MDRQTALHGPEQPTPPPGKAGCLRRRCRVREVRENGLSTAIEGTGHADPPGLATRCARPDNAGGEHYPQVGTRMTAMRLRLTTIWRQVMHPLSYVAGAGLTALLIWLLLRRVDFHEVGQALRRADLRYLPPIALLFALRYWLRAVRW